MNAIDKLPPAREDYRYNLALYFIAARLRASAQCYRNNRERDNEHGMKWHLSGLRADACAMRSLRIAFDDWRDLSKDTPHAD